ncbi:MAG: DUF3592 domain-containing protein [Clostridiales bacterium]|nr:DUF3592 domain-containing protein [Clostridiales bacterium]
MSDIGFTIWLMGMFFISIPMLTVIVLSLFVPKYKGKARGKVTDCFRHDTDEYGREAPEGFGKHVSYQAHYVFEVDGEKYRGYGNISSLSKMTRRVKVRYDPADPSRNRIAMSPMAIIAFLIVMALWTALVLWIKSILS